MRLRPVSSIGFRLKKFAYCFKYTKAWADRCRASGREARLSPRIAGQIHRCGYRVADLTLPDYKRLSRDPGGILPQTDLQSFLPSLRYELQVHSDLSLIPYSKSHVWMSCREARTSWPPVNRVSADTSCKLKAGGVRASAWAAESNSASA